MEITFQNKREDFEAFYDYMVKETHQGQSVNKQALRSQQVAVVGLALFSGMISLFSGGGLKGPLIVMGLLTLFWESLFLIKAGFKPRYYYGKQAYRNQENNLTAKDIQIFSLPRKITTDGNWLEVSSSEAIHRWRWRRVDQIGLTSNFIFIHVGNCPVVYVPKRDFPSEQNFIEFGKKLVELKEKNKDQPIGAE